MRKLVLMIFCVAMLLPALAAAETFKNVAVMDNACSQKQFATPDEHTRACALQCQQSGFGVITSENKFLKLDDGGNSQLLSQLKKSQKKDHLRVDVTGDVKGDTLRVKSISLL